MRILVCGDRNWSDKDSVMNFLKQQDDIEVMIEGEARGADSLARDCAKELGLQVIPFPAKWEEYGRAAGPIRNNQMLKEGKPDLIVAFHDDLANSKGTKHMVTIGEKAGVPVVVVFHWAEGVLILPKSVYNNFFGGNKR